MVQFLLLGSSASHGPLTLTRDGWLYVNTASGWLDYEQQSDYHLSVLLVEVANAIPGSPLLQAVQGNASQVISVVDVNESPYFVTVPTEYRVDDEALFPAYATPYSSTGIRVVSLDPYVTASYHGVFLTVFDEDLGNNSALVVTVTSVSSSDSGYLEALGTDGTTCVGNMNCTLRVRADAPRIDYDAPNLMRVINVTVTVTDPTGLVATTAMFDAVVEDVNQGTSAVCPASACAVVCWSGNA